jgi:zinc transport system permease protein
MNTALLFDPLFHLPFLTGLVFAAILPLLGMYLRLRNEWLAALAFSQVASAGALLGMGVGAPLVAGGLLAALAAALAKGYIERVGDSGYGMLMLLGWGASVLVVANVPVAEQLGHALFDGQLYFTGALQLTLAMAYLFLAAAGLRLLSRRLLLARFFPDFFQARGLSETRYHLAFDCLIAGALALATTCIGVMAAFALVFIPPLVAYRWGSNWRRGLLLAALVGVACYVAAFAAALVLDQPFGPLCAILLVAAGVISTGLQRLNSGQN